MISVEKNATDNCSCSNSELKREREVEYEDAGHAGDDDGKAAGEPLQNIVGVLDDHGHQESAESVLRHGEPDKVVVAVEKSMFSDLISICEVAGQEAERVGDDGTRWGQRRRASRER